MSIPRSLRLLMDKTAAASGPVCLLMDEPAAATSFCDEDLSQYHSFYYVYFTWENSLLASFCIVCGMPAVH